MTTAETMIHVNEDAVHALYEGHVEDAIDMLYESLATSMGTLNPLVGEHDTSAALPLEALPLTAAFGPDDGWEGYDTEHFRLYRFIFTVRDDEEDEEDGGINYEMNARLYALLTYNLALLYHHQGLMSADLPTLSQASSLYNLCLEMIGTQQQQHQHQHPQQPDYIAEQADHTLELAIYNNLGHCCSFMGDLLGVVQCQEALRNMLMDADPHTLAFVEQHSPSSLSQNTITPFASMAWWWPNHAYSGNI